MKQAVSKALCNLTRTCPRCEGIAPLRPVDGNLWQQGSVTQLQAGGPVNPFST